MTLSERMGRDIDHVFSCSLRTSGLQGWRALAGVCTCGLDQPRQRHEATAPNMLVRSWTAGVWAPACADVGICSSGRRAVRLWTLCIHL